MPTVNICDGQEHRFTNGGQVIVWNVGATQDYKVINLVDGSIQVELGHRQRIPTMHAGVFSRVIAGDDQLNVARFSVNPDKESLTTASVELLALLRSTITADASDTFKCDVKIYDSRGGTTGALISLTKCFLAEPPQYAGGGPGALDTLAFVLNDIGGLVTPATFA